MKKANNEYQEILKMPDVEPPIIPVITKLKVRDGYQAVISLLYQAMYTEYDLKYKDFKKIINYIMEEYK